MAEKFKPYPARVVLITGVGGVGKSGIIREILKVVDAESVNKDEVGDQLTQFRGSDYVRNFRSLVYQQVFDATASSIKLGRSVFVDASFRFELLHKDWEAPYRELAESNGGRLQIVRIWVDPITLRKRVEHRRSSYDIHKLSSDEAWQQYLQVEPIFAPMPARTLYVENNGPREIAVRQVMDFIGVPTLKFDLQTSQQYLQ